MLLLGVYLCERPTSICSFALVPVVEQMLSGASPINLVLAQMLIYMRLVHEGDVSALEVEDSCFSCGFLISLLFWRLLWLALVRVDFGEGHRWLGMSHPVETIYWLFWVWVVRANAKLFYWKHLLDICPWWEIFSITNSIGADRVVLLGLEERTFYSPRHLCRKYGHPQSFLESLSHLFVLVVPHLWYTTYLGRWNSRVYVPMN